MRHLKAFCAPRHRAGPQGEKNIKLRIINNHEFKNSSRPFSVTMASDNDFSLSPEWDKVIRMLRSDRSDRDILQAYPALCFQLDKLDALQVLRIPASDTETDAPLPWFEPLSTLEFEWPQSKRFLWLWGSVGSGKTTWALHQYPNTIRVHSVHQLRAVKKAFYYNSPHTFVFDDVDWTLVNPVQFIDEWRGEPHSRAIFISTRPPEVQFRHWFKKLPSPFMVGHIEALNKTEHHPWAPRSTTPESM